GQVRLTRRTLQITGTFVVVDIASFSVILSSHTWDQQLRMPSLASGFQELDSQFVRCNYYQRIEAGRKRERECVEKGQLCFGDKESSGKKETSI
ncbi:MAG: hypothetical protein AAF202_10165, partial [Pseudomonadota bacterium]